MEEPEDKGPRYRIVMFVALAAIVVPGFLLLNWIGDNGVSQLFRSLVGLDQPRPRITRTATPTAEATATFTAVTSPATAAPVTSPPGRTPTVTISPTVAPATPTVEAPSPIPTEKPLPTATPPPPTSTPTPRPVPTETPKPEYLGYGTAQPAYGGAAVIRAEPTTASDALGSIPLDERVLVIRIVEGEAIDPVESRWWEVEYEGLRGFVYYKLIRLD